MNTGLLWNKTAQLHGGTITSLWDDVQVDSDGRDMWNQGAIKLWKSLSLTAFEEAILTCLTGILDNRITTAYTMAGNSTSSKFKD